MFSVPKMVQSLLLHGRYMRETGHGCGRASPTLQVCLVSQQSAYRARTGQAGARSEAFDDFPRFPPPCFPLRVGSCPLCYSSRKFASSLVRGQHGRSLLQAAVIVTTMNFNLVFSGSKRERSRFPTKIPVYTIPVLVRHNSIWGGRQNMIGLNI